MCSMYPLRNFLTLLYLSIHFTLFPAIVFWGILNWINIRGYIRYLVPHSSFMVVFLTVFLFFTLMKEKKCSPPTRFPRIFLKQFFYLSFWSCHVLSLLRHKGKKWRSHVNTNDVQSNRNIVLKLLDWQCFNIAVTGRKQHQVAQQQGLAFLTWS